MISDSYYTKRSILAFGPQKKYRKKPIVVLARQCSKSFTVKTIEGVMKGNPGDYIVTGIEGESYPVKKEIFEKTYEEI